MILLSEGGYDADPAMLGSSGNLTAPGTYASVERWHYVHYGKKETYLLADCHVETRSPVTTANDINLWANGNPAASAGFIAALQNIQDWYAGYRYAW